MHICVFSPDFPTSRTIDFVFVEQLCRALALQGQEVSVIAPQTLTKCLIRNIPVAKEKEKIYVGDGKYYTLIRPKYISVGNIKGLLKDHNSKASIKAVVRGFKKVDGCVDVAYAHFWQSVLSAYHVVKDQGIPLFASSGEEIVSKQRICFTQESIYKINQYISGSIHVSTNNKNECLSTGLIDVEKSIVIPNAINNLLFYPRNKQDVRKQLGISEKSFVVTFVGQFTSRKGTLRLDAALKKLNDSNIKAIFIGQGPENPTYDEIILKGRQAHDNLPPILSASDVFVLPTLQEGCCNAVIEALACGLPVISSDRPFNYDVLDGTNSILIDPENVDSIAEAIKILKDDDEFRRILSNGALVKAKSLTLNQRVERILSFIEDKISNL